MRGYGENDTDTNDLGNHYFLKCHITGETIHPFSEPLLFNQDCWGAGAQQPKD